MDIVCVPEPRRLTSAPLGWHTRPRNVLAPVVVMAPPLEDRVSAAEDPDPMLIVLFVVVFGCTFLFAFLNQFIPKFFESIESLLNTLDPTMFSVGLLITSFILYFISMLISIRVYKNRVLD